MLLALPWSHLALLMLAGVLLDLLLGEPRRFHALVGFGTLARKVERRLNQGPARILRGGLGWLLLVLPAVLLTAAVCTSSAVAIAAPIHILLLYFCLGLRSLRDHVLPIADALGAGDLPAARALTARIVSRDTGQADETDLAKAGTESLLENGNDAVFGTLFWFAVAGGPGALLFRLANTLDAMWGYRNARFLHFGRIAARVDDLLNLVPARLTALSYALLAPTLAGKRRALHCWRTQSPQWSSPNAGPVMSSGAGALGIALGGAATYNGILEQRPPLGEGHAAIGADIHRAWRLVAGTVWLWLAVALSAGAISWGAQHA
jgi:adenosylcobinamide-phosphate synthase